MGPLFIPKATIPPPSSSSPSDDRSTPEGQEPDRNEDAQSSSSPAMIPPQNQHIHNHHHTTLHQEKSKKTRSSFNHHHHHHHRPYELSDTITYDLPNQHNSALRKYVLLASDCVAIKFARTNERTHHLEPAQKYPDHLTEFQKLEMFDGGALFNSFMASNKFCYWNAELSSAVNSLEYKGYIHPSTILVYTTVQHMHVLRNAWSRRILRDPPGFRSEFLGEIEEIVSQPVLQGQFAPLSDSLCWAISEITRSGQEAFIDSIQARLYSSFPSISQPPKELIFQTLEKLIKEQKIYQTSHGYYIVTPDVSTFINYSRCVTPASNTYGRLYSEGGLEKPLYSRYSTPWGSTPSVTDPSIETELRRILSSTPKSIHLKRHNSLKIIRNKHESSYQIHNHPSMGQRSLSFRLSKCNSLFESDKESEDNDDSEPVAEQPQKVSPQVPKQSQTTQTTDQKSQSTRSFFTRLFTFRCTSRPKPPKPLHPNLSPTTSLNPVTTQTPPTRRTSRPPPPKPTQQAYSYRSNRHRKSSSRASTSSSVSGIYASITQKQDTLTEISTIKRPSSMYDLQHNRWMRETTEASDVSR